MARLIAIHELEVPEDQRAEFEQFLQDELCRFQGLKGWSYTLLKGQRGDRREKYAIMVDIDRSENHRRYFPEEGVASTEYEQVVNAHSEFYAKFHRLVSKYQREHTLYQVQIEAEKQAA